LAASLLRLDDRVKVVDQQIAATFHRHQLTEPRNPTTPGDSHTSPWAFTPRRANLHHGAAHTRRRSLTTSLRFPVPGDRAIRGFSGTL
jgi:hypothetical protein